jgi:hypothetical protein
MEFFVSNYPIGYAYMVVVVSNSELLSDDSVDELLEVSEVVVVAKSVVVLHTSAF